MNNEDTFIRIIKEIDQELDLAKDIVESTDELLELLKIKEFNPAALANLTSTQSALVVRIAVIHILQVIQGSYDED